MVILVFVRMHTCMYICTYLSTLYVRMYVHVVFSLRRVETVHAVVHTNIGRTVKPVYKDHSKEHLIMVSTNMWSLCRGATVLI